MTCFIFTVLKKRNLNIRKCTAGVATLAGTCQNVKLLGVNTSICFCNTDGCNEAEKKNPVRGLLVLVIFVVYILLQDRSLKSFSVKNHYKVAKSKMKRGFLKKLPEIATRYRYNLLKLIDMKNIQPKLMGFMEPTETILTTPLFFTSQIHSSSSSFILEWKSFWQFCCLHMLQDRSLQIFSSKNHYKVAKSKMKWGFLKNFQKWLQDTEIVC